MSRSLVLVFIALSLSACSQFGRYHLEVGDEVRMQRGFVAYQGDGEQMLSHTIAVGFPGGLSYVYDLETGRLVGLWRGGYINARGMWDGRGSGRFEPLGDVRFLAASQPLQVGERDSNRFQPRGYTIDELTGRPEFHYRLGDVDITDHVLPLPDSEGMQHSVTLSRLPDEMRYELLEAGSVKLHDDGSYAIDGKRMKISEIKGASPHIVERNGSEVLVLDIQDHTLRYSVSW